MGDAAGELAERFELLRLEGGDLRPALPRVLPRHQHEQHHREPDRDKAAEYDHPENAVERRFRYSARGTA